MSFPVLEPLTLESVLGWIPIRALPTLPPDTTTPEMLAPPLTDETVLAAAAELGLARSLDELEEERLIDLPSRVWEQLAMLRAVHYEGVVRATNDAYHRLLRVCQRAGVYVQEVVAEAGRLHVTARVTPPLYDWVRAELASIFTAGEEGAVYELAVAIDEPARVADALAALQEALELDPSPAPAIPNALHRVRHASDGLHVQTLHPVSPGARDHLARYQDYHTSAVIRSYPAVRSFIGPFLSDRVAPFLTARVHAFLAEIADDAEDDDYGTLDNLFPARQDLLAIGEPARLIRGAIGELLIVPLAGGAFSVKYRSGYPSFALYETVDLVVRSELAPFLDAAGYLQGIPLPAGPGAWIFQRLEGFDPNEREDVDTDTDADTDTGDDRGDTSAPRSLAQRLRENIFGFVTPPSAATPASLGDRVRASVEGSALCTLADAYMAAGLDTQTPMDPADRSRSPLQRLAAEALGGVILLAPSCNSLQRQYAQLHGWDMASMQEHLLHRYHEFMERGTITYELAVSAPAGSGGWLLHNVALYVQRLVIPLDVTVEMGGAPLATLATAAGPVTLPGPITLTVRGNLLSMEEALAMQALLVMARRQALQRQPAEELLALEDGLLPTELFTFLTVPEGQRTTLPAPVRDPTPAHDVYFFAQEEVVTPRRAMARLLDEDPLASFALVDVRVAGRAWALFSCVTALTTAQLRTITPQLLQGQQGELRVGAAVPPFDLTAYHRLYAQLRADGPTTLSTTATRALLAAAAAELGLLYRAPSDGRVRIASHDYKLELLQEGAYFRYNVLDQRAWDPSGSRFTLLTFPRAWVLADPALLDKLQRIWGHGRFLTAAGRMLYRVTGKLWGMSLRPELARFIARRRAVLGPADRALLEEWYEETRLGA